MLNSQRKSYPATERGTWTIIHTESCLVLEGTRFPYLHKSPLKLAGRTFQPGDRFIYMGGKKTSAGVAHLDFRCWKPMVYQGQMLDQHIADATSPPGRPELAPLAVFTQDDSNAKARPCYYAWHYQEEDGVFMWGTHANAGRIIEHDLTALEGEEVHAKEDKETTSIARLCAEFAEQGLSTEDATARIRAKIGKVRITAKELRGYYEAEVRRKAKAAAEVLPAWFECAECWHRWRSRPGVVLTCPACDSPTWNAVALAHGATAPLFLELDTLAGIATTDTPPT